MSQDREDLSVINNVIFPQAALCWSLSSNRVLVQLDNRNAFKPESRCMHSICPY